VIRAEEHLSNTPRQIFIAQALGYPLPEYAHLPYVAEPGSKNKLSKRKLDKYLKNRDFAQLMEHGQRIATVLGLQTSAETFNPVIVDFYEQVGYLPDAIINYLLLLGWSFDDKREFFTRDEMIANFSLERVTKAPASFDSKKLWAFQDHYMQAVPLKQKVALVLPYLQKAGLVSSPPPCDVGPKLARIVEATGDRLKVAGDILLYADFFFTDRVTFDPQAVERNLRKAGALALLAKFKDRLAAVEPFEVEPLEKALQQFVAHEGIKVGDIIHALRVAVTGKAVGPGLYDCLELLGRETVQHRIERTLAEFTSV
jgi:glutamyl-tRNA synthetase